MNEIILGGSENISSVHNSNVIGSKLKGLSRAKTNALGDVRNTLHSRPTVNTPAAKQVSQKGIFFRNGCQDENAFSVKKDSSTKKPKPIIEVKKNSISSPKVESWDVHNHNLCEQADEACFNSNLSDYRLSENDIQLVVRQMKAGKFLIPQQRTPISFAPCDDIEIGINSIWEDKDSSISEDSMDDLVIPEIAPPEMF
ncbi:hypothetical protein RUM43_007505 [Polyplax serrata]|uniref:Uncharacterized protein n=1 Tax=Polyplax serrata TaxID=468196 RepID=A0AAN8P5S5_POLSC